MKRAIIFLLVLVSVLGMSFGFAGCDIVYNYSNTDEIVHINVDDKLEEIEIDVDEDYSGELNVLTWSDPTEQKIMNAYIEAFNKKYPNIRINYEQDLMDNYYPRLKKEYANAERNEDYEDCVDVFWLAQDMVDDFYSYKTIMFPLSEIKKIDDSFDEDLFVEESVQTCSVGEQMFIMPRDFSQVVMYFNVDMFEDLGIPKAYYPKNGMTQDEFEAMLGVLRMKINQSSARNDYGALYKDSISYLVDVNAGWDSWMWPLLRSFNGTVVNPETKESSFDSEETLEAVQFWRTLRDAKYVPSFAVTDVGVAFRTQRAPIYIHSRSLLTDIYETKEKGVPKLGVVSAPQFGETYSIGSGATGYCMYMNSPRKTAAWLFLKFIASEEGQTVLSKTGNGIPSLKSMIEDPNAEWRKFTNSTFDKTYFDNDAFVYGMDFEEKPYTSTREFFKYIPVAQQQNVLKTMRNTFGNCCDKGFSLTQMQEEISKNSREITKFIKQG